MHDNCGNRGGSDRRFNWRGQAFSAFADRFGEQITEAVFGPGPGFAAGFGGPRRGGGRPGGRKRVLDAADLRLVLLHLIAEQPRHGYELIKAIETLSGGVYAPSPGMVYPTLTLIADVGEADEKAEGSRKLYAITEAGTAALAAEADAVKSAMARLEALAKMSERTDSAPVRRAMRNLHTALHTRLSDDNSDRELQLKVAAILDEAASRIERL
ncbi:PadR family transcriptional regulator [Sandarakinorhabdus sp. DWP1-3-1]|uniref:PadR family transcriptional regulator n=1 Tax=Sandarakinorhabdus sp. DWP1-3-1 TaxID=2804627 RepID=UPI003CEFB7A0